MIVDGSNQEISPTKRGERTYPETQNALSKQSAGGGEGKNAGRKSGRPKAVNQGGEIVTQEPRVKDAVQSS
ncbi:hypothetical protein TNCV_352891 [Trichonephila clavipes]|nr:hypothetical protein TNCV_352891 [Trichonephila clavipes]